MPQRLLAGTAAVTWYYVGDFAVTDRGAVLLAIMSDERAPGPQWRVCQNSGLFVRATVDVVRSPSTSRCAATP